MLPRREPAPRTGRTGFGRTAAAALAVTAMAGLFAPPVLGQTAPVPSAPPGERQLEVLEQELEQSRDRSRVLEQKAAELAREITALQRKAVTVARAAQDTEEDLSALETRLAALQTRQGDLSSELGTREAQMATVLTGLQRLAWRPPEALLVQPAPPHDVVRGAILLRAVVPTLDDRAANLRGELETLATVRADITAQRAEIARTVKRLDGERAELAALMGRKADLRRATEADREAADRRATTLAADADSMRELLARLEEERQRREAAEREQRERAEAESRRLAALAVAKPTPPSAPGGRSGQVAAAAVPASRSIDEMRGAMPMPARGTLIARYGEPDANGTTSRGVTVATRPSAQVIAPSDGTVAFAGPFRGYGQLLIMEHGGGYHTLLSGMFRIDAVVGQRLLAGEPVGVMAPEGSPPLYVEIRRDGRPVNPLPWLSARKG